MENVNVKKKDGTKKKTVLRERLMIAAAVLAAVLFVCFDYTTHGEMMNRTIAQYGGTQNYLLQSPTQDEIEEGKRLMLLKDGYGDDFISLFKRESYLNWSTGAAFICVLTGFGLLACGWFLEKRKYSAERRKLENYLFQDQSVIPLESELQLSDVIRWKEMTKQEIENLDNNLQARDRYLENLVHQLKSTVSALQLEIELLETPDNAQEIEEILSEARRIDQMLSFFLKESLVKSNLAQYQYEQHDLKEIVEQAIGHVSPFFQGRNQMINTHLESCLFYFDAFWIQEAIETLLKNASCHGPENGKVEIELIRSDTTIVLKITNPLADGVDPQLIDDQIFDRYNGAQLIDGHFGIGLSMAREIITNHHGQIKAKTNSRERTAIFQVVFPVLKQEKVRVLVK